MLTKDRFVHELADVQTARVGQGTKIWQFCVVLSGASIGSDCNICSHCFVENDVVVGDRVTIKCGVQLWDGITIEDDVFIGPNVTFTNDRYPGPRGCRRVFVPEKTVVERGAVIGAGATVLPGLVIGEEAQVGAGAVVTKSVPPGKLVVGVPAKVAGDAKGQHGEQIG